MKPYFTLHWTTSERVVLPISQSCDLLHSLSVCKQVYSGTNPDSRPMYSLNDYNRHFYMEHAVRNVGSAYCHQWIAFVQSVYSSEYDICQHRSTDLPGHHTIGI